MTVAHFGEEGAYAAEAAAQAVPGGHARALPLGLRRHAGGDPREADSVCCRSRTRWPASMPETYDALAHAPLAIVDEAVLPVPHVLVGLPQTNIDALTRVHSPPDGPLAVPPVPVVAARHAARRSRPAPPPRRAGWPSRTTRAQAAISSRGVAQRHGLSVLLNDVSDHAQNYTRFVTVAPHTRIDRDARDWRTAIRFVTHHHPGALHDAIEPLRRVRGQHDLAPVPSDPGPAVELPVLCRRRGPPARHAGVRGAAGRCTRRSPSWRTSGATRRRRVSSLREAAPWDEVLAFGTPPTGEQLVARRTVPGRTARYADSRAGSNRAWPRRCRPPASSGCTPTRPTLLRPRVAATQWSSPARRAASRWRSTCRAECDR